MKEHLHASLRSVREEKEVATVWCVQARPKWVNNTGLIQREERPEREYRNYNQHWLICFLPFFPLRSNTVSMYGTSVAWDKWDALLLVYSLAYRPFLGI